MSKSLQRLTKIGKKFRRTKIVATLGPNTCDLKSIKELIHAGANLFRINFSHDSIAHHMQTILYIREAEKSSHYPVGIIADIQGPKIRIGELVNGELELSPNQEIYFTLDNSFISNKVIHLPHPEIFELNEPIKDILLNDGKIKLKVTEITPTHIKTQVLIGGTIKSKCGFNLPNNILPFPSLTQRDIDHIQLILNHEVDYIAISFIQSEEDVHLARQYIRDQAKIIAKIERKSAIEHLDKIIEAADATMVARGDLGVECTAEKIPGLQKLIIKESIKQSKPVIVATQMMETMITNPVPSRAEVADIAAAIYDGADALALTAETAIGEYPIACVKKMSEIIFVTEKDPHYYENLLPREHFHVDSTLDAITHSLNQITQCSHAKAIVCFSHDEKTSLLVSKERPKIPIFVFTTSQKVARQMTLAYGIVCYLTSEISSFEEMISDARKILQEIKVGTKGDKVILTTALPFGNSTSTNSIHILEI